MPAQIDIKIRVSRLCSNFHMHFFRRQKKLNTNLGKTARFYAVSKFYVPGSSGNYSGLAIGGVAWNNIVGIQYVSATDYKHYYTFPKGTYLVNINLFANLEASTSNVLGVAIKIEVDDTEIANPWFRMIDSYQSISYPVILYLQALSCQVSIKGE